ncbi:MAG: hypothetical protein FWG03_11130 [Clostridiales bacterium]|nr:hypothetical protein [Clostridiales bacterium]
MNENKHGKPQKDNRQQPIHTKVLGVVFLAAIFFIGSATFPQTAKNIASFLTNRGQGAEQTQDLVSASYSSMLDFKGPLFINKGGYINLNGLMARAMGQRYMNEAVKLDNGHLINGPNIRRDLTRGAGQITKIYERQKEKGAGFLYVAAPNQLPVNQDLLPAGFADYSNQNADDLFNMLGKNGVPAMDLREKLIEEGIDHSGAFFVTDHHWTPETGFWAYTKTIEYFVQAGLIDPVDPMYTDIGEYNIEVYEDLVLGTEGRRTGKYFAGFDDISVITPKFETDITVEIPALSLFEKGPFEQIAFDREQLRPEYFVSEPYAAYGHGSQGYIHYENEEAPVNLKILAIGDSFSNVPFTFLPLVFRTCDELDMRLYKGDFEEYYLGFDPDIVLILTSSANHMNSKNITYDYFNDIKKQ